MALLPLAILGGAKLAQALFKKKGATSAAKEQKRADEANLQAQFESESTAFENKESDRLARMRQVAGQLQGARALSPEVIAAALQRRANTARKGAAVDRSKGLGWNALGDITGTVGDFASAYMAGNNPNAVDARTRTMGTGECPPGTQGSNGECY